MSLTIIEQLLKKEHDNIPVSKKLLNGKKCFLLRSVRDIPGLKVKRGDLMLFECRKPKQNEITTFVQNENMLKIGIYKQNSLGEQGIMSVINGDLQIVLHESDKLFYGVIY